MKLQKEKLIIVLTVLIDVLGVGIIIPVLPFYVESFGASAFMVTMLFSVFALFSFVSGPFLGALSDKVGRRPILIISIASTAIGWFVFASGKSLWILFLGRILDGAAAGNFPIAQSYLVDISRSDKERTANLGLIGAMWGVGFILGPILGASLSAISPSAPFWTVGAMATLNVIGALFFLPETHHQKQAQKKLEYNPLTPIIRAIKDKPLLPRYIIWLLFGIAFSGMNSIFALYVKDIFGFSQAVTGYVFTGMGILIVINQMFALKNIWLKYFKEISLEIWFFLIMALGFLFADVEIFFLFAIGMLLITLAHSTLRVVISSGVVGMAGNARRGEVLGIMSSILSVSMILGPILNGALYEKNTYYPFAFNSVLLLFAFFIIKRSHKSQVLSTNDEVEVIG